MHGRLAAYRVLAGVAVPATSQAFQEAAGLRQSEPAAIKSWTADKANTYALCPPQRAGDPPRQHELYQEMLDWLVWFEGATTDELLSGSLYIPEGGALRGGVSPCMRQAL